MQRYGSFLFQEYNVPNVQQIVEKINKQKEEETKAVNSGGVR
jgi:hypothetical protein